jgi:hypothetical protein
MQTIAPESPPKFAGHETFTLRYGWLKKAVDATLERQDIFLQDDALVTLGVGKNMVRAIRHWGLVTGVLEENKDLPNNRGRCVRPSPLGEFLFGLRGLDPFLEEVRSLWLIHWQLAAMPDGPTTWFWVFNHFTEAEFTKPKLLTDLAALADQAGWKRVADSSLRRDIDCFLRTYVPSKTSRTVVLEETLDSPLAELGLIQELEANRVYGFARGEHASLPVAVFAYALLTYWERTAALRNALTFDEVAYRPGSPGRVFKLSEDALSEYLDAMEACTKGAVTYSVTAGLRQLYRRSECSALEVLRDHYAHGRRRKS